MASKTYLVQGVVLFHFSCWRVVMSYMQCKLSWYCSCQVMQPQSVLTCEDFELHSNGTEKNSNPSCPQLLICRLLTSHPKTSATYVQLNTASLQFSEVFIYRPWRTCNVCSEIVTLHKLLGPPVPCLSIE